jgi:hypothetical protein
MSYEVLCEKVKAAFQAVGLGNIKIIHDDDMGVEIDGWLYITREDQDTDQGRNDGLPIYELSKAVDIPGGHWQPADVDIVPLYESATFYSVILEAGKALIAHQMDQYFTHLAEEECAKECEKYTKEYVQSQLAI